MKLMDNAFVSVMTLCDVRVIRSACKNDDRVEYKEVEDDNDDDDDNDDVMMEK